MDHRVLFDSVIHPADLDVLGTHSGVHRDDAHAPGGKRFAHLGPGVLRGGLAAQVDELHEGGAVRLRRVLPGAEDHELPVRRQPQVQGPLAFRDRNRLGSGGAAHAAEVLLALLARLPVPHDSEEFLLLLLEPGLLTLGVLLFGDHHGDLPNEPGIRPELPQVPVLRRVRGEARGGEQDRRPVRPDPDRSHVPRPGEHRPGARFGSPHEEVALAGPGGDPPVARPDEVRSRNGADAVLPELDQAGAVGAHREPRIVGGQLAGLGVLAPAEVEGLPVRRPAQVAGREPEDAGSAAEMIQRDPEAGIGVGGGEFRLAAKLDGLGHSRRAGGDQERREGDSREKGAESAHGGLLIGSAGSGRSPGRTTRRRVPSRSRRPRAGCGPWPRRTPRLSYRRTARSRTCWWA